MVVVVVVGEGTRQSRAELEIREEKEKNAAAPAWKPWRAEPLCAGLDEQANIIPKVFIPKISGQIALRA